MTHLLFIVGVLFPLINWLSLLSMPLIAWRTKTSVSMAVVPFVGPVVLDIWLVLIDAPVWTLILPWVGDIGTLITLYALCTAIIWRYSRFTRIVRLAGGRDGRSVVVDIHRSGHYRLRVSEDTIMTEEKGAYTSEPGVMRLLSRTGQTRELAHEGVNYLVSDPDSRPFMQLDGWQLAPVES